MPLDIQIESINQLDDEDGIQKQLGSGNIFIENNIESDNDNIFLKNTSKDYSNLENNNLENSTINLPKEINIIEF